MHQRDSPGCKYPADEAVGTRDTRWDSGRVGVGDRPFAWAAVRGGDFTEIAGQPYQRFAQFTPIEECTIVGIANGDVLEGTPGPDVICGRGGLDTMKGMGGEDAFRGERGRQAGRCRGRRLPRRRRRQRHGRLLGLTVCRQCLARRCHGHGRGVRHPGERGDPGRLLRGGCAHRPRRRRRPQGRRWDGYAKGARRGRRPL